MTVLITGSAGFIGSAVSRKLVTQKENVVGIDNHNSYYSTKLKQDRVSLLLNEPNYTHVKIDINDRDKLFDLFFQHKPDYIIHLAAQAGVRYANENPYAYIDSNVNGFLNILEACRISHKPKHLVYASTSSVYGANKKMPFSTTQNISHPLSLYAATKMLNENMAHVYSYLHNLPTTGLRFFTVYGPWGRPDMALFKFTESILKDKPIEVFNYGNHKRDFTYIDDIVAGILRVLKTPACANENWDGISPDPSTSIAPWRIYNIGNNNPVDLNKYIAVLENLLGKVAAKKFLPLQAGDVQDTYADVSDLVNHFGYKPNTSIETGVANFVNWYREYYKV